MKEAKKRMLQCRGGWGGGHCMKGVSHNVEADERVSAAVNNMSNRE